MRIDADEVLSVYEALGAALGSLAQARRALQVLDGYAPTVDNLDFCIKRKQCAEILRQWPTISNGRLARELQVPRSTAHKWRKEITRASTDRVTVDGLS